MHRTIKGKNLVLVLATFTLVASIGKEVNSEQISCIQFLVKNWKYKISIQVLINFSNEINAITSADTFMLGIKVYLTAIGAQKINGSYFKTSNMVITRFQVLNKLGRAWFI